MCCDKQHNARWPRQWKWNTKTNDRKKRKTRKKNMSPEWDGISNPILHLHPPPGTKIALDRHLRMWKGKYSVRQSCRPSHSGAYSYKNDTHCKCAQNLKRRKNGNRSFSVVSNYWISHFFSFLLFVFSVLRCNHTISLHIWGIKPISSFILAPSCFFFLSLNVVMWALGLSMCSADFSDYCYPSFVYTLI